MKSLWCYGTYDVGINSVNFNILGNSNNTVKIKIIKLIHYIKLLNY